MTANIAERFESARIAHRKTMKFYAYKATRNRDVHPLTADDVEQELLVVLYQCCIKYDPDKGARFSTFVQRSFNHQVITMVRYAQRQCRDSRLVSSLSDDAVAMVAEEVLSGRSSIMSAETIAIDRMTLRDLLSPEAAANLDELVA